MPEDPTPTEFIDLATLLDQLQTAVERARRIGDNQHQERLERYLEADGTPRVTRVKVPHPQTKGWREIEVPLLALVPPTSMQISQVTVEFNAGVQSLLHETGAKGVDSPRETTVRLQRPPPSGAGQTAVKVVFAPTAAEAPHRSDVTIRFLEPGPDRD